MASPRGVADDAEFSPRFNGHDGEAFPPEVASFRAGHTDETQPTLSPGPRPPSDDPEVTDLAPTEAESTTPPASIESTEVAEDSEGILFVDAVAPQHLELHNRPIPEVFPVSQTEETERDAAMTPRSPIETTEDVSESTQALTSPVPSSIGRYRLIKPLGSGGFGRVFLAQDDLLQRQVAVKILHPFRVLELGNVDAYLEEARAQARVDHPYIVTVYDAGRTDDGFCFIISKAIEGTSLAAELGRPSSEFVRIAELTATV
ncbi:protein kinase domain-containing protein, partial [Singulisphaera rosea]